jgi:hypothetical protein
VPVSPEPRPDVIPSEVDPDYDCVRLGSTAPDGRVATPPPGGHDDPPVAADTTLCPDGYVPRRRREPYEARGKRMISKEPPQRNPGSRD